MCLLLDKLSREIRVQLPDVAEYMVQQEVGLATAFTQSLLTICTCDSELALAVRVMDLFILQGESVLFTLILSCLRLKRQKVLSLTSGVLCT